MAEDKRKRMDRQIAQVLTEPHIQPDGELHGQEVVDDQCRLEGEQVEGLVQSSHRSDNRLGAHQNLNK